MKLFTIRHCAYKVTFDGQGRKLVHTPDSALDDLGRQQTHQLCAIFEIRGISFDAIYTSPYRRAKETADIVANDLNIPAGVEVDGLKDVFPNSANGKPWEELERVGGDIYVNPLDGDPQESLTKLVERAGQAVKDVIAIAKEKGYQSIAVVSHGDTLSAIDWFLHNSANPTTYKEMKDAFYLQKAEACGYTIDENIKLLVEGEIITPEAVGKSLEGFRLRGPGKEV